MQTKVYSNGTYQVEVREDGAIQVKPGDWLSKYSAAIYDNTNRLDLFVRPGPNGSTFEIMDKNLITVGETILHKPTWDNWRQGRPGRSPAGNPSTGPGEGTGRYDRDAAVAYARRWARSHNREFERAPSDDVNFVSQCLLAGGWSMVSRGEDYPGAWWSADGKRGPAMNASRSWFRSEPLSKFLHLTNRAYQYACVYRSDSNGVGKQWGWPGWLRSNLLRSGDLIHIGPHHWHTIQSMIVTETAGKDPEAVKVCYHA